MATMNPLNISIESTTEPENYPTELQLVPYSCPKCSGTNFGYTTRVRILIDNEINYLETEPLPETEMIFCLDCEHVLSLGGQNVRQSGNC